MTDATPRLAPALDRSRSTLAAHLGATTAITAYCHALLNTSLRPASDPPEKWFVAFEARLATARQHAEHWINTLGPAVTSQVPQTILDFNDTFDAATGDVLGILESSGGELSSEQVGEIHQLLGALLSRLGMQKQTILDLQAQLQEFATNLSDDHAALLDGAAGAQREIGVDEAQVTRIRDQIALVQARIEANSDRVDAAGIGIGLAIFVTLVTVALVAATAGSAASLAALGIGVVGLGTAVAFKEIFDQQVKEDFDELSALRTTLNDEEAQIAALHAIISSVQGLASQNEAAQEALAEVLAFWQDLEGRVETVIADLTRAGQDLAPVLEELDLRSAQIAWQELGAFATDVQRAAAGLTVSEPLPYPPASKAA